MAVALKYNSLWILVGIVFSIGRVTGELMALDDDNIHDAVKEWFSNPESAEAKYGKIQDWDTSRVQNYHSLFKGRTTFNEDISKWNTSSAVSMGYMFNQASSFNQNLSSWDTRNVRFIDGIFNFATSFNGDISSWDTGRVLSLDFAFSHARSFNSDISTWNVSSVRYMAFAFWNATSFSQDLNGWNISSVDDIIGMFYNATSFDQTLCWDLILQDEYYATRVFCNSPGSFDLSCSSNPDLLTKLHWGCLEPQDHESLEESINAESTASDALHESIIAVLTKPDGPIASDSEAPREPSTTTTTESQTFHVLGTTPPHDHYMVRPSDSEAPEPDATTTTESQTFHVLGTTPPHDHDMDEPVDYPSIDESETVDSEVQMAELMETISATLESSESSEEPTLMSPTAAPTPQLVEVLTEKKEPLQDHPSPNNDQSTTSMTTTGAHHSGHNNTNDEEDCNLKYVAIAFASGATILMIILFIYVTWKRRLQKVAAVQVPTDGCTLKDTDSEEGTPTG